MMCVFRFEISRCLEVRRMIYKSKSQRRESEHIYINQTPMEIRGTVCPNPNSLFSYTGKRKQRKSEFQQRNRKIPVWRKYLGQ